MNRDTVAIITFHADENDQVDSCRVQQIERVRVEPRNTHQEQRIANYRQNTLPAER